MSFYINFHTSIFRLLFIYIYIFWKPFKIRLPFYSLACGIGVGVKFEFSIKGVRCDEAGYIAGHWSQVTVQATQFGDIFYYIKMTVT